MTREQSMDTVPNDSASGTENLNLVELGKQLGMMLSLWVDPNTSIFTTLILIMNFGHLPLKP